MAISRVVETSVYHTFCSSHSLRTHVVLVLAELGLESCSSWRWHASMADGFWPPLLAICPSYLPTGLGKQLVD